MTSTAIWDPNTVLASIRVDREIDEPNGRLRCNGLTKHNALCRNPIAEASWDRVLMHFDILKYCDPRSAEAEKLLDQISKLILCKGVHQYQAPVLLSVLQENIAKRCPTKQSRIKTEDRATGHTERKPLKEKTNVPTANMASKMLSANTVPSTTMLKAEDPEVKAQPVRFEFGRQQAQAQAQTDFHFECSRGKPTSFKVYVDPPAAAAAAAASCSSMPSTRNVIFKMEAVPISQEDVNVKAATSEAKLEAPISTQTHAPVTATSQDSPKADDEEEVYQSFVDVMHSQAALVGHSRAPIDPASDSATLQQFQKAMRLQYDLLPETPATNAETLAQFKSGMALLQMVVPASDPMKAEKVDVIEESDSEEYEDSSCLGWHAVVSAVRCRFSLYRQS